MKTLKKTLCLVLAVVMVVGVLILPAYAADDYSAAIKNLQTYGVLQGYPDGDLHEDASITRGQMAAIIYRIMTGDTESTDDEVSVKFGHYANVYTDANVAPWAKGYIGWCTNQLVLKGYPGGTVQANKQINGYEVQAMLLRALGRDKNNEYTGDSWKEKVLADATKAGIIEGVNRDPSQVTPRGAVAQMAYNAACKSFRVAYNASKNDYEAGSEHLIEPAATTTTTQDEWGIPSKSQKVEFTWPDYAVTNTVKIPVKADAEYWVAKDHCDVAVDLGLTKDTKFNYVYTNGVENVTNTTLLVLNDKAQIGAQGRHTLIYKSLSTIVYIDTLLAKVTDVKDATFDSNNHLKTKATLKLDVFDDGGSATPVTLTNGSTNYTWTKGQYLLVNYHQNDTVASNGNITAEDSKVRTDTVWEKYETYGKVDQDWNEDGDVDINDFITVLQEAPSFVGAQTLISSNSNTHTIDGTVYNDNNRYGLNDAGDKMKVNYTWYQDTKNNLLGSSLIAEATSYGVINKIYWTGSDGDGAVYAEVTYVDGTTDKLAVNVMTVFTGDVNVARAGSNIYIGKATNSYSNAAMTLGGGSFYVNADAQVNATADKQDSTATAGTHNGIINEHLFKIVPAANGTYDFVEVAGQRDSTAKFTNGDLKADLTGLANASTDIVSGKAVNGAVRVDSETLFLVRSGSKAPYTFTSYVGYNEIGDYVSGEVDYVEIGDDDAAADVVYITANPKGEQGWHLFFNTAVATSGNNYLVNVDYDGSVYTVHGILDGEVGTIKVKANQQSYSVDIANYIANKNNGNQLWMVYIQDGYVTDINGTGTSETTSIGGTTAFQGKVQKFNDANGMGTNVDDLGAYAKLSAYTTTVTADTKVVNNTITLNGAVTFSINDNVPLVGDWDDLATAAAVDGGYTVLIVCDENNKVVQSYIFEAKAVGTSTGTGKEPETVGKITANINLVGSGLSYAAKDYPEKTKNIPVVDGKLNLTGITVTDPDVEIKVNIAIKGETGAPSFEKQIIPTVSTSTSYTWEAYISGLLTKSEKDVVYEVSIIAVKDVVKTEAEVNDTNYAGPDKDSREETPSKPAPGVIDSETWNGGNTLYTALGIIVKAGTSANDIIIEIDEDTLNKAVGTNNDPRRLISDAGDETDVNKLPAAVEDIIGYVGVTVGNTDKSGFTMKNIEINSNLMTNDDGTAKEVKDSGGSVMFTQFYAAIIYQGGKWVAREKTFVVEYDLVEDGGEGNLHYTWNVTVKAK